jgi:hypothetical protein
MAYGVICQCCGIEAPSRHVQFHQNIGALVIRFNKSIKGNLCKRCIHRTFWSFNAVNITVGWLGYISLIVAPCFIINNLVYYLGSLGMPATPRDAKRPQLDPRAIERLRPYTEELFRRAGQKEPLADIAASVARQLTDVSPGQVVLYMIAVQRQMHQAPMAQPARPEPRGFEVIQQPPPLPGAVATNAATTPANPAQTGAPTIGIE